MSLIFHRVIMDMLLAFVQLANDLRFRLAKSCPEIAVAVEFLCRRTVPSPLLVGHTGQHLIMFAFVKLFLLGPCSVRSEKSQPIAGTTFLGNRFCDSVCCFCLQGGGTSVPLVLRSLGMFPLWRGGAAHEPHPPCNAVSSWCECSSVIWKDKRDTLNILYWPFKLCFLILMLGQFPF